jgi:RNA polymerase sigma-70 factor, ECF subfamily
MDEAQFDALYSSSARRLIGVIYVLTGDLGEAQDVVHEAFMRAWDRRAALADVQHPEAWVRTVAWRLAVSRWRRTRNAVTAWRRLGPPSPVPEPGLDHLVLAQALAQLKPTHRRVLVLHYLCDLSVEAIAAHTGLPSGTVKVQLHRGRAALAERLSDVDLQGDLHA